MAKTRPGAAFDAIIDQSEKIFYGITYDVLDEIVQDKARNAQETAVKLGREFFRTLARGYMGQPAPGPFGDWADLSPKWAKYKAKKLRGSGKRIYYGISPQLGLGGHLRAEMAIKNGNVLFGSPKVRTKAASDLSGVEGKIIPVEKLPGRFQFAPGSTRQLEDGTVKKIGGKFVTPKARVTVEIFRKIVGLTSPEIFEAIRYRDKSIASDPQIPEEDDDGEDVGRPRGNWLERLAGNEFGTALGGRVPARPLLAPFMVWWLQNTAYRRIEEALQ